MSSIFASNALIAGGTITQVNSNDVHSLSWVEWLTLDNTGLFGANGIKFQDDLAYLQLPSTEEFFSYFTEFLESPERSPHFLSATVCEGVPATVLL